MSAPHMDRAGRAPLRPIYACLLGIGLLVLAALLLFWVEGRLSG